MTSFCLFCFLWFIFCFNFRQCRVNISIYALVDTMWYWNWSWNDVVLPTSVSFLKFNNHYEKQCYIKFCNNIFMKINFNPFIGLFPIKRKFRYTCSINENLRCKHCRWVFLRLIKDFTATKGPVFSYIFEIFYRNYFWQIYARRRIPQTIGIVYATTLMPWITGN